MYFVVLTVGFSLGVGLAVIVIGLPIVLAVNLVNALAHATGIVATALLDTPEAYDTVPSEDGPPSPHRTK